jgi:hypothetical protein
MPAAGQAGEQVAGLAVVLLSLVLSPLEGVVGALVKRTYFRKQYHILAEPF